MTTQRSFFRTAGGKASSPLRTLAFSLLATGLVVLSAPAAAQSRYCDETIDAINSARATQTGHESEQKALLAQIDKIDEGERSFRQQLQSGDCRPEGADADDKRPSCKVLLDVILSANKMRDSLKGQLDTLKRMAADAVSDEQKLVQLARTGGCPPYGKEPQKKATAPAKKPKKATRKRRRRRATVRRPPRESRPPPPRSGVIIQFGPGGGIGMGF